MEPQSELPDPTPASSDLQSPVPFKVRQPPPMREVTKGWFTMREEAKTVEQLLKEDRERRKTFWSAG